MKDFTRKAGRLAGLPRPAKIVYTIFLAFTLAALGLTVALLDDMVGLDLSRDAEYYAGAVSPALEPPEPVPSSGPVLDLPDDLPAVGAGEPMSRRKLLEVTHFHLFSMPVYLLILSHLFMLSRARPASKTAWILVGALGTALHIAAPWAATSGSTASTALYATSGLAVGASYLWMTVVPLWEMWRPVSGGAPRREAAP